MTRPVPTGYIPPALRRIGYAVGLYRANRVRERRSARLVAVAGLRYPRGTAGALGLRSMR